MPTRAFFYGVDAGEEVDVHLAPGVSLFLGVDAIGDADEKGIRLVYCRLNGQHRALSVRDHSVDDQTVHREKAVAKDPSHIAAPFAGLVSVHVAPGDRVLAGQTVATIEAMKMEAAITSSVSGVVSAGGDRARRHRGGRRPVVGAHEQNLSKSRWFRSSIPCTTSEYITFILLSVI